MRKELIQAQQRGYLKRPRRSLRLYNAWYQICEVRPGRSVWPGARPFIAWEGNHLTIDLIATDFRFTEAEQTDLAERWRNSICRERNHCRRHVYRGIGPDSLHCTLCSHTMPAYAEYAIALVLRKAAAPNQIMIHAS
jgi:hypothetical protein